MATVLLYHALCQNSAIGSDGATTLFVELDRFDWQLGSLRHRGYRSLTLDEFYASLSQPRHQTRELLLTFDDAYAHVLETASPLLHRHGFTAVAFVPVAHVGARNSWDGDDDRSRISRSPRTRGCVRRCEAPGKSLLTGSSTWT